MRSLVLLSLTARSLSRPGYSWLYVSILNVEDVRPAVDKSEYR